MWRKWWILYLGLILVGGPSLYHYLAIPGSQATVNLIETSTGVLKKGVPRRLKIHSSQEKEVLEQIKHSIHRGITENKRTPELIMSFTSFPHRISKLYVTLYSLFTQTLKPDRIILWLAREEFQKNPLPAFLKDFERMGLEVRWVEENMRSYNKLVPTLQAYPEAIIITVDDDRYYASITPASK